MTGNVDGRRTVLAAVAGGNFAQLGARLLVGPLVPLVIAEFETSTSGVGLALTGMWAVYALLQFPSGVLADRFGERTLLAAGLCGTTVGALLVGAAPTLVAFGASVLLLGAGAGLYFSPASSLLSRLFEEHGGALGALTAAGAVAGVAYPAVGGVVGVRFGWRPAMFLGAVATVPFLLATVRLVPRTEPTNPDRRAREAFATSRLLDVLGRPGVAFTTTVAVSTGFAFQAIASFLPTFLVVARGVDAGVAGLVFGGVYGLSSVAQPVAGWLSDRTSRDAAIAGSAAVAGSGLVVLLAVPGTAGLAAGAGLLGVGISWPGTVQARLMDQFDEAERGYGFGLTRSVYMLFAATGSVAVGTVADVAGWTAGFGVVVAVFAGCLLLLGANRALGLDL